MAERNEVTVAHRLTPDELDRLIDGLLRDAPSAVPAPERDTQVPEDLTELLSAAREVRELAEEPIPVDVRDRHLATIRQAAEQRRGPAPGVTRSGWLAGMRRRAAAVAAATGLVFTATGGGAVAIAQSANPGDALYGLKRASEGAALAVTSDDPRLHLRFAERRLDELGAAPGHAAQLADEAALHLGRAQERGADLGEAAARAVARLSELAGTENDQLGSENARIAVSRACARIAEKHGHDPEDCGYDGASLPGRSGEAPGRQGDAPGDSGDAPGRTSDTPRGDDAPAASGDAQDRPDGTGPPDEVPGEDDGTTEERPGGS